MAFKETVFITDTQKAKIYKEDDRTLVLEIIEIEDKSSVRLYMDKQLAAQISNQLAAELETIK